MNFTHQGLFTHLVGGGCGLLHVEKLYKSFFWLRREKSDKLSQVVSLEPPLVGSEDPDFSPSERVCCLKIRLQTRDEALTGSVRFYLSASFLLVKR